MSAEPTAKPIIVVSTRPATPVEKQLRAFFDQLEADSLKQLEEGARQIIGLVSALLGVVLGVLALGDEKFAAALQTPLVIFLAAITLLAWLLALLYALAVVIPGNFYDRRASLDDMRQRYAALLQQKGSRLYAAAVAFGCGAAGLVALVITLLLVRAA